MAYSDLEKALLENDCAAVIDELAQWSERERAEAWKQIDWLLQIRRHRNDAENLSTAAAMKLEALRQLYGEEGLENIYYRMSEALKFVQVGLSPTPFVPLEIFGNKRLQTSVARLLIDRRPPWLEDWYRSITADLAWNMDYVLWVCLFHAGMIPKPEDDSQVLQRLIERFPDSFDACPAEAKWTLSELPALRWAVLTVCEIGPQLAGRWAPAAKWLAKNDMVDRTQAVQNALRVLKKTKRVADRRSLMRFIRAIDATGMELQGLQADLAELLADKQPDIAGNAILELLKIADCCTLDPIVLQDLPRIFLDKTKLYAIKALELASAFATDVTQSGKAMCVAVAALDHVDASVQQSALQLLKKHLREEHADACKALEASRERLSHHLGSTVDELLFNHPTVPAIEPKESAPSSPKTVASPKEFQQLMSDLTSARTGRLERIKSAFDQGLLLDDRFREALLNSIEDRNIELADFIADHVLTTLEPSVLPDLKSKLNLKGKLAHGRRLRVIYRLDPTEGKRLVRQAIKSGSVEVKTNAISCLEDSEEDWSLLLEAFQSDNSKYRIAASRTVCGMGSPRAIEAQLRILESDDLLLVLDSFLEKPVPAIVSKAKQIVREKLSHDVKSSNEPPPDQLDPQFIALLKIAISIDDDDAAELLIECLKFASAMDDKRISLYEFVEVMWNALSSTFAQGLDILLQNIDNVPPSLMGELFRLARRRLKPAILFDLFSRYLREANAPGGSREDRAFRYITHEISKLDDTTIGDYVARLQRNDDLDPRWLDVALEESLHSTILSLLIPGHLATWNYLLERVESEQAIEVESRNRETVLALLLTEYPDAEKICMCALREVYLVDSYAAQRWLHLATLLSHKACEELDSMQHDSLCPKVNQEIIAMAIQEIGKRRR